VTAARTLTQRRRPHPQTRRSGLGLLADLEPRSPSDADERKPRELTGASTLTPSVPGNGAERVFPSAVECHGQSRESSSRSSSRSRSCFIAAVAIAKLVSLMRGPHEAAADLESAIGGYWPLIIAAIAALTVGFALAAAQGEPGAIGGSAGASEHGAAPDAECCGDAGHRLESAHREDRHRFERLV